MGSLRIPSIDQITGGGGGGLAAGAFPVAAIGAGFSGGMNFYQQQQTNQMMENMANRQMSWQAGMSNTAHQREVADLKKAGLNPILSAGGGGASTPSGASPSLAAPQIDVTPIMEIMKLDQGQQRLQIDKALASSSMASALTDQDLNRARKIMVEKSFNKADVQSSLWDIVKETVKKGKQALTPEKGSPIHSLMNDLPY